MTLLSTLSFPNFLPDTRTSEQTQKREQISIVGNQGPTVQKKLKIRHINDKQAHR